MTKDYSYRYNTIGGSDIAAILSLSNYATPLDIYNQKVNRLNKDLGSATRRAEVGKFLEPYIIEYYEKLFKVNIEKHDTPIYNKDYPFFHATIDGFNIKDTSLIECKVVFNDVNNSWGEEKHSCGYYDPSGIPPQYLCQIIHYSYMTNAPYIDLVSLFLFGNLDIKIYRYFKDEFLEKAISSKANSFYLDYIKKKIPPPPSSFNEIKFVHTNKRESVLADKEDIDMINEYSDLNKQAKALSLRQEYIKLSIIKKMTDESTNSIASAIKNNDGNTLVSYNKNLRFYDVIK